MACMAGWMSAFGFRFDPSLLRPMGMAISDRDVEYARLLRYHDRFEDYDTRTTWPNFRIDVTDEVRALFNSTPNLSMYTHKNQWAVVNGPAIAAVHSVYGFPVTPNQVRQFKLLRAVDADWYDKANVVAMNLLLDRRFKEDNTCFQTDNEPVI
jgi:hypothetical protein